MTPWQELGRAKLHGGDLILSKRGGEFAIRLRGLELMNSRQHQSEEQLSILGCAGLATRSGVRVLIGGLGMGFTARAALDVLAPDARVVIAELVPEVLEWNRGPLGPLAGAPLDDPRTEVVLADVIDVIGKAPAGSLHAILLDTDNGPDAFTAPENARLYGIRGLERARRALAPGGRLGVWSVADDKTFTGRMRGTGFAVEVHKIAPRPGSGAHHIVWMGSTPGK